MKILLDLDFYTSKSTQGILLIKHYQTEVIEKQWNFSCLKADWAILCSYFERCSTKQCSLSWHSAGYYYLNSGPMLSSLVHLNITCGTMKFQQIMRSSVDQYSQLRDWYPWSTCRSILDRHSNRYSVDTLSTLDQQSVDSRPSVDWLMNRLKISWLSADCWPRCWSSVDQVSTEVSMEYQLRVSIEGIDWGYIVLIDTHNPFRQRFKTLRQVLLICTVQWVYLQSWHWWAHLQLLQGFLVLCSCQQISKRVCYKHVMATWQYVATVSPNNTPVSVSSVQVD